MRKFFFVCIVAMCLLVACGSSTSTTNPTSSNTAATTQPTAQPTIAPTKTLVWITSHTYSGNGSKKTVFFTVPDNWKIIWTCTRIPLGDGTYMDGSLNAAIMGTNNFPIDVVIETCGKDTPKASGETEEHQGGQFYFDVNSTGEGWTLQIQELK